MQKSPPLKTLPVFVAVAKHLSFSRAAEELCVTHSAVSQSIKQLETFLGLALFQRQTKTVRFTEVGQQYYQKIAPILESIYAATESITGQATNRLTVNTNTTLAMHWLIARIPAFQAKYPEVDLRLASLGPDVDFKSHAIDCAIAYGVESQWPNFEKIFLFEDELVLVGHPSLKIPNSLEKLLTQQKTIFVKHSIRKDDWASWCQAADCKLPSKSQRINFQSSSLALQAVLNGIGVLVTHRPFVVDALQAGHLKLLSKITVKRSKAFYLIYPKAQSEHKNIQYFQSWLLKTAR